MKYDQKELKKVGSTSDQFQRGELILEIYLSQIKKYILRGLNKNASFLLLY